MTQAMEITPTDHRIPDANNREPRADVNNNILPFK